MEQPFMTKSRPFKMNYEERKKNIVIYSYTEHTIEDRDYCSFCEEENCSGQCLGEDYSYDKDQPAIPKIKIENMNLQKILDMLPENINPADVTMSMYSHDWCGVPYTTFSFSYEKTFAEDLEQFEIDLKAYELEYKEYEIKKSAYDQWVKEEEIKKLEEKISAIKNRK